MNIKLNNISDKIIANRNSVEISLDIDNKSVNVIGITCTMYIIHTYIYKYILIVILTDFWPIISINI